MFTKKFNTILDKFEAGEMTKTKFIEEIKSITGGLMAENLMKVGNTMVRDPDGEYMTVNAVRNSIGGKSGLYYFQEAALSKIGKADKHMFVLAAGAGKSKS